MNIKGRALHFVFKISNRNGSAAFYRNVLGMKALRHEEFSSGCDAQCNGAYEGRWSKTMVGYGPEDTHFVVELTYNYGVKSYERGNDFLGLTIQSSEALARARQSGLQVEQKGEVFVVAAPDGYPFHIIDKPQPTDSDPVKKVCLASSNLARTIDYWNGKLGLKILQKTAKTVTFAFDEKEAHLEFHDIGAHVTHATAYGRIAFSAPTNQLEAIQKKMQECEQTILTPLVSLDTPGKADVVVVILADPDGHEICFVGDEGFRELSQVDPKADSQLDKYIRLDKS